MWSRRGNKQAVSVDEIRQRDLSDIERRVQHKLVYYGRLRRRSMIVFFLLLVWWLWNISWSLTVWQTSRGGKHPLSVGLGFLASIYTGSSFTYHESDSKENTTKSIKIIPDDSLVTATTDVINVQQKEIENSSAVIDDEVVVTHHWGHTLTSSFFLLAFFRYDLYFIRNQGADLYTRRLNQMLLMYNLMYDVKAGHIVSTLRSVGEQIQ